MRRILVLNGPNLGRLGSREPEIYGVMNLESLRESCQIWGRELGIEVDVRQTDEESELISWIYEAVDSHSDVVLNPAAFTHYSYALRDACAMLGSEGLTLVEVHLSNPHTREKFRHYSVISGVAAGTIAGFGFQSYRLALEALGQPAR